MGHPGYDSKSRLSSLLETEHPRLVRLCARITGNHGVAEDLAQETLVEAWRSADRLRDPSAEMAWLHGIARNVCKRWARRHGRDAARVVNLDLEGDETPRDTVHTQFHSFDLEAQLERWELIDLLDRALDLLPPVTRDALIQQFIDERPQREISQRLGLSRGAVAMRVQRGKALLKKALLEHFPDDVESFGLLPSNQGWVETCLWCPLCGTRRFRGTKNASQGEFILFCPECYMTHGTLWVNTPQLRPGLFYMGDSYHATYARFMRFLNDYYEQAASKGYARCLQCGEFTSAIQPLSDEHQLELGEPYGAHLRCPTCHVIQKMGLRGRLLATPEGQRFHREYPRVRTLPEQELEVGGRPAIVSKFQSTSTTEALVTITDLATLRPFQFHRTAE